MIFAQYFLIFQKFICNFINEELKSYPEVRTMALIELENNFPQSFSREILKCLSDGITKLNMKPITTELIFFDDGFILQKKSQQAQSLKPKIVLYIADNIDEVNMKKKC